MTTWQATVMGPVMSVSLAPGCHNLSFPEGLFRVFTPYSPQRVLSKAAKRLAVSIDSLTLQQHKDQLRVVVACPQPAFVPCVILNLTTKQDVHLQINPGWTCDHLLLHVAMVVPVPVGVCFLDTHSRETQATKTSVIGQLGEFVVAHDVAEVTVQLAQGCFDWPDANKFTLGVAQDTTTEDVQWQMSRLLRRPLDHVVAIIENPKLITVHLRCQMAEPTMVVWIDVDAATDTQQQVRLDVAPSWTVRHVKRHLALLGHDAQTPLGQRQLCHMMKQMDEDDTLATVVDGQRLTWSPWVWLKIALHNKFHTGLYFPFDATIAALKKQVQTQLPSPVPNEWELVFQGEALDEDHQTLRSYGIVSQSWIDMESPIDVCVVMCGAQPVIVKAWLTMTVVDFCTNVLFDAVLTTLIGDWERYHLVFGGLRLEPNHTLRNCKVSNNDIMQLLIGSSVDLFIARRGCRDLLANADSGWTVAEFKKTLSNVSRLFLGRKELADDRTLESYHIQHATVLIADDELSGWKQVIRDRLVLHISCVGESDMSMLVGKSWTVEELKTAIEKYTHLPAAFQHLTCNRQELADDRQVGSYEIKSLDTLHVCHNQTAGVDLARSEQLQNFIILDLTADRRELHLSVDGRWTECIELHLSVDSRWTIAQLKTEIEKHHGLLADGQRLTFADQELSDDRTVDSYHFVDNAVLQLRGPQPAPDCEERLLSIVLPFFGHDRTLRLTVAGTKTVAQIKTQIEESEGFAACHQKLVFCGEDMSNDRSIASYCKPDDLIFIMLWLCMKDTHSSEAKMTIVTVYVLNSYVCQFAVDVVSCTVARLKSMIRQMHDKNMPAAPAYAYQLKLGIDPLDDERTLGSYGISDDDIIRMI